jgi:hypothetical protein
MPDSPLKMWGSATVVTNLQFGLLDLAGPSVKVTRTQDGKVLVDGNGRACRARLSSTDRRDAGNPAIRRNAVSRAVRLFCGRSCEC